jgi:hypothetical protein
MKKISLLPKDIKWISRAYFFSCANTGCFKINQLFYNAVPITNSILLGCNIVSIGVEPLMFWRHFHHLCQLVNYVTYMTLKIKTLQSLTSKLHELQIPCHIPKQLNIQHQCCKNVKSCTISTEWLMSIKWAEMSCWVGRYFPGMC